MKKVLVPLAEGCEEMEAVIITDVLRRAGWEVVTAGLCPGPVTASRRVRLMPDALWDDVPVDTFDALVLPGGNGGSDALRKDERILKALRDFHAKGLWIGAICAAPRVLFRAGILEGKTVTCFPGVEKEMPGVCRVPDRVVVDGRLVTSQGPGTSFEFALKLIEVMEGADAARRVESGLRLRS